MPNWVYNTMSLRETKKGALQDFLNATLKMDGYDVRVNSGQDWLDKMKNHLLGESYKGICLSTFVKRPETYDMYDTTNHPNGERLVLGETTNVGDQKVVVTEEVIQDFKNATLEQEQKYGVIGWYDWNCLNYGCKWDTCMTEEVLEISVSDDKEGLTLKFETPWSDPLPIFGHIFNGFPDLDLTITVEEEAGFFNGEYNTIVDEEGRHLVWKDIPVEDEWDAEELNNNDL